MKLERKIYWNREFNYPGEDVTSWYFLIVNKPREIKRIKTRIYEALAPTDNQENLDSNLIPGSDGLHYDLFKLESPRCGFKDPKKVYNGRWKRERRLCTRQESSTLLNIIEQEGLA